MTYFEKIIKTFLATMACMFLRCYITDPKRYFTRERKMNYRDFIKFIFYNNGRNNDIEATEFFRVFLNKKYESISHQAIGKQRLHIKSDLFIKIYQRFINLIYSENKHFSRIKGYIVCACDGSIFDLPNVTLTRLEFNIDDDTIFENHRIRARVSGMLDVNSKFMLVTEIVERTVKETTLAMRHLNNLKKRIDITKFIGVYDRAYKSIELMLFTQKLNSKFLIRLPKSTFAKERRKIKGNDKIISINLRERLIKDFENEDLKEYARNLGYLNLRIVEIQLENGTIEYLATNLDSEEFSLEDLKELYAKRWSIETGFRKLKSQIHIERFSGHHRTIIEQDFYAKIFLYNLATAIQWDAEKQMTIKKRNDEDEFIYKANFASIVGMIFIYLDDILSSNFITVTRTVNFLIERSKNLYHQKNLKKLREAENEKIINDLILQKIYGDDWESKKPARTSKDPTNKHPGNPKPTH